MIEQTEETKKADKSSAMGLITSVMLSGVIGWGYLISISFVAMNIPYLLSSDNDAAGYAIAEIFYLAFKNRYGSGVGGIICLGVVAMALFSGGISSVTSNSRLMIQMNVNSLLVIFCFFEIIFESEFHQKHFRLVYAFARDGAMPLSSVLYKVNKHEVPINAVWLSVVIAFCMALTVKESCFILYTDFDKKISHNLSSRFSSFPFTDF